MELPQLGLQCTNKHCKQLDFLPLQCQCGQVFCAEHLNNHASTCEMSRFLAKDELKKLSNLLVCSKLGCGKKDIVPLICLKCNKHYCITHRHVNACEEMSIEQINKEKEKYAQPLRNFNEAKAIVDEQVQNNIAQAKNKNMAAKLRLMKIKNKATGLNKIPNQDRLYFDVHVPTLNLTVPVFISKTWSLGRAIDAVAEECKLSNYNNKNSQKKLRLFKKGGEIISNDLGAILMHLQSEQVIVNGEELTIEYVNDN